MIKCPECGSEEVGISLVRRLTYKIEDSLPDGELDLGALIEEEEMDSHDDEFFCIDCEHTWAKHEPRSEEEKLETALRNLKNESINDALDQEWRPMPVQKALTIFASQYKPEDIVCMDFKGYREDLDGSIWLIEGIYEHEAEVFLEA